MVRLVPINLGDLANAFVSYIQIKYFASADKLSRSVRDILYDLYYIDSIPPV